MPYTLSLRHLKSSLYFLLALFFIKYMQNVAEIKKTKINMTEAPRVAPAMITTLLVLLVVVAGGVVTAVGRVLLPIKIYR